MKTNIVTVVLVVYCFLQGSLLQAAGEEGVGWGPLDPIGRWFNLLVLVGGLFYFLRAPARDFFATRKADIQRQLRQADEARQAAEARLAEAEERMKQLDGEVEQIRLQAREEAQHEAQRVKLQAEEEARRILAVAGREIENLGNSVRQDLREYAAELGVRLAAERLKGQLDEAGQARIVERFLDQLSAGGGVH